MNNTTFEQFVKRLGEALCLIEEQRTTIRQQEAHIKILEARLAQHTEVNEFQPPRPWRKLIKPIQAVKQL